jgi:hypothetical protein
VRLLYSNLTDSATIDVSSENLNHNKLNLLDARLTRTFETQVSESQFINFSFDDDSNPVQVACIAGHNISSTATIELRYGNDQTFTTYTAISMPWREDIIITTFATVNAKYWQMFIDDVNNVDGYLAIGRTFLGEYLHVEPSYLEIMKDWQTTDKVSFSISRQPYGDLGEKWRQLSFEFYAWSNAMKIQIEAFDEATRAGTPFFLIVSDDEYSLIPPMYGIKGNDLSFVLTKSNYWKTKLVFIETK